MSERVREEAAEKVAQSYYVLRKLGNSPKQPITDDLLLNNIRCVLWL
jgi:hypothetical protein